MNLLNRLSSWRIEWLNAGTIRLYLGITRNLCCNNSARPSTEVLLSTPLTRRFTNLGIPSVVVTFPLLLPNPTDYSFSFLWMCNPFSFHWLGVRVRLLFGELIVSCRLLVVSDLKKIIFYYLPIPLFTIPTLLCVGDWTFDGF